jgi:hypothetical protein
MKCNIEWFYHTFLYNYLYFNSILVIQNPDDGHSSDQNMLLKNNMSLNIFINVHLLVHHISI